MTLQAGLIGISSKLVRNECLRAGIGVHHAKMPRFVSQEMIRRFNSGELKLLLCTSTIIEGVNTAAKIGGNLYTKTRFKKNWRVHFQEHRRPSRQNVQTLFRQSILLRGACQDWRYNSYGPRRYRWGRSRSRTTKSTRPEAANNQTILEGWSSYIRCPTTKSILRENYFIEVDKQEEVYKTYLEQTGHYWTIFAALTLTERKLKPSLEHLLVWAWTSNL